MARLDFAAFDIMDWWAFNISLISITRSEEWGTLLFTEKRESHKMHGVDVSSPRTVAEKSTELITAEIKKVEQAKQLENPDARVVLEGWDGLYHLGNYANALVGMQTSDDPMFVIGFWELGEIDKPIWEFLQATPDSFCEFDGESWLVKWEQGKGFLFSLPTAYPTKGLKAVGKPGLAIHRMRQLFAYRYGKESFHQNVAVILPHNPDHLTAIWCFCSSPEYNEAVRRIDQTLKVTNATLVKVPFDLAYWTKVAQEKYPNGLPKPYSDGPTQWIFHGHPAQSDAPLQVAVARLLGYRWPVEQDSAMELSDDARAWVKKSEGLLAHADRDGIVCIPAVRSEQPGAERLLDILCTAYSSQWSDAILHRLLTNSGCKPGTSLDEWLRDKFFEQHCKRFHDRPFIWHIWDGRKDGFSCLVNYHTLDHQRLETLTYAYLQDWITAQAAAAKEGKPGADLRLAAAQELQGKLKLILAGEPPYDIFVRWKPIHEQPIGWNPDLNDGVRVNIRPFVMGNVLRKPPHIKWTKDRGKEPERAQDQFPWFWENGTFKGDRINDYHLTNAQKRAVRDTLARG